MRRKKPNSLEGTTCHECRTGGLHRQDVSQEFEREGHVVKIEGIPAFVCDHCGEIFYPPELGDHIIRAADELFAVSQLKLRGKTKGSIQGKRSVARPSKSTATPSGKPHALKR